jgi:hypothetical protein
MTEIILHHYDASPFTQKALRMLRIRDLAWLSVEMPMILPKPDLVCLTGGYRGTPVMQIDAAEAHRIAQQSQPELATDIDEDDAQSLEALAE